MVSKYRRSEEWSTFSNKLSEAVFIWRCATHSTKYGPLMPIPQIHHYFRAINMWTFNELMTKRLKWVLRIHAIMEQLPLCNICPIRLCFHSYLYNASRTVLSASSKNLRSLMPSSNSRPMIMKRATNICTWKWSLFICPVRFNLVAIEARVKKFAWGDIHHNWPPLSNLTLTHRRHEKEHFQVGECAKNFAWNLYWSNFRSTSTAFQKKEASRNHRVTEVDDIVISRSRIMLKFLNRGCMLVECRCESSSKVLNFALYDLNLKCFWGWCP